MLADGAPRGFCQNSDFPAPSLYWWILFVLPWIDLPPRNHVSDAFATGLVVVCIARRTLIRRSYT